MCDGQPGLGLLSNAMVAARGDRIAYAGPEKAATPWDAEIVQDCGGRLITPGLVDCHSHLVFGGDRSAEFEMRLAGASYAAIAEAGGGILSTVRATRAATEAALVASALPRLDTLIAEGVTTIEIKSGYGLDLDTERRMLRAARSLAHQRPIRVRTSFLGAHALPPEAGGDKDAYIDHLCSVVLPTLARDGLVDAVDGFCETIAFTPAQVGRVFETARTFEIAGEAACRPVDRRGRCGARRALRRAVGRPPRIRQRSRRDFDDAKRHGRGSSAWRLLFPARRSQAAGQRVSGSRNADGAGDGLQSRIVAVDVASPRHEHGRDPVPPDSRGVPPRRDPGKRRRPWASLNEIGTLEVGKCCDLAIWTVERPAELVYRIGFNPLHSRVWSGQ